jgi:hypothetical protein
MTADSSPAGLIPDLFYIHNMKNFNQVMCIHQPDQTSYIFFTSDNYSISGGINVKQAQLSNLEKSLPDDFKRFFQ